MSLSEQYEEKVRPYIDLIDSLRVFGVEKDLALPAIAVIGDQSSGKSSVLEALSGVALPRGSGIMTRCPLELKMKKSRQKDFWHGKIKYKDIERDITDPADVERLIINAQNDLAGALGMSNELISLEVTSTNAPDLTFIDLPGIVGVPFESQPEEIGEQIKSLIKKFITKKDTIILVVVPCNVDINTSEVLKMAQKIDLTGERTLGILTKPDLVDKGMEDEVVSVVNNDIIFLTKGYMVVTCRGQQEVVDRISLYEAIKKENDFFREHPHFRMLYKEGKATIPKLAEKLTLELVLHIEKSLPQLKEQIQLMLAETQTELDRYNSGPPTDPEQWMDFLTDTKIENIKQLMESEAESMLKTQFKMELMIYTQDKVYTNTLEEEDKRQSPVVARAHSDTEATLEQLTHHLKSYYSIASKRLADQVPLVIKYNVLQESAAQLQKEMLQLIKNYNINDLLEEYYVINNKRNNLKKRLTEALVKLIASNRLADQVPLVIKYKLLQESAAQLQREMLQLIKNYNINDLLEEDYDINIKRNNLKSRQKRLTEALVKLVLF
ncbi:hypothetical protein AMELA_G00178500 [Ameiurus melas]|uniref:Uncharacterized protein n=1 Tax=Ameiurus melas TaxID=219545 RepID=A0A7J6A9V6_AMEME|nr:hypothetical protein AMELA_G00178500 [Ameiurus melas]